MRHVHVALAVAAVGVVTAVACSFPTIGYQEATGGGGKTAQSSSTSGSGKTTASSTHASASASGAGGGGTGGAGTGGGSTGGAGTGGAGTGGSSSSASSASSSSGNGCVDPAQPCDCDGDGDNANTAECDYDGGDCNDHDPLVNSKQTMWFDTPGTNGWDYNCDGNAEYQYTDMLDCSIWNFTCDTSTQKWDTGGSPPGCGESGAYGTCMAGFFSCNGGDLGMRVQGCH